MESLMEITLGYILGQYQQIITNDEYYKLPVEILKIINMKVVEKGVKIGN